MSKIQQLFDAAKPGQILTIHAADLGLPDEQFHALVVKWHSEAGNGFRVLDAHRESETGKDWIDFAVIQKI